MPRLVCQFSLMTLCKVLLQRKVRSIRVDLPTHILHSNRSRLPSFSPSHCFPISPILPIRMIKISSGGALHANPPLPGGKKKRKNNLQESLRVHGCPRLRRSFWIGRTHIQSLDHVNLRRQPPIRASLSIDTSARRHRPHGTQLGEMTPTCLCAVNQVEALRRVRDVEDLQQVKDGPIFCCPTGYVHVLTMPYFTSKYLQITHCTS